MKITNKKIAQKKSSVAWLQRQANDPYVARAQKDGYRARAVYKLAEINEKFRFLKNGQVVVDLGAAPGSWSQYVAREFPKSRVIAMDLLEIKPIPGVEFYMGDFTTDEALEWLENKLESGRAQSIKQGAESLDNSKTEQSSKNLDNNQDLKHLNSKLSNLNSSSVCDLRFSNCTTDVVLSDMAPNTTGHQKTDHLRQMVLLEYAWDFARRALKPGGTFVAKSFTGGTTDELLRDIKKHFQSTHHIKPPASRKDSVEMFIVGLGFKEINN